MRRFVTNLRFASGLLAPGGVLVLATWAVQREEVIRAAAEPYAGYFCFGSLAAAVLLSWYYDQSRLLCSAAAIFLTVLALEPTHSPGAQLAAVFLLPLNVALFAVLKERGVLRPDGLLKVAVVAVQAAALGLVTRANRGSLGATPSWVTQLSFAFGLLVLIVLVFNRRTKVEQGLMWALIAMCLGTSSGGLYFYSGTAGVILVFAVLEHGYDLAYRDELTGLPGRRAFSDVMKNLGGTYALAMCDVDHFKRFNDTYGHDVGDQVLRKVAGKLSHVGGGGRAFRYGGEEFLIIFRGRSASEAEPFAESLRRAIADEGFVLRGPDSDARKTPTRAPRVNISISIGIAERSKRHSTPELVLDAADATLYRAKEAGRNCVKLAESS